MNRRLEEKYDPVTKKRENVFVSSQMEFSSMINILKMMKEWLAQHFL
jgi:hypothetical protein